VCDSAEFVQKNITRAEQCRTFFLIAEGSERRNKHNKGSKKTQKGQVIGKKKQEWRKKMFTFKFDSSKKEEANKFCSAREENEREHSTCFFLYGLCQQKLSTVFFRIGENRKKVLRDNQKTHKRK
jgi:hypothetical protein